MVEATRRLRATGVRIPIIALTADRPQDYADAGCTAHLAKPVDADRLIALIVSLARKRTSITPTLRLS